MFNMSMTMEEIRMYLSKYFDTSGLQLDDIVCNIFIL